MNEAILTHDQLAQQSYESADSNQTSKYVEAQYLSKKDLSESLATMVAKFVKKGGKVELIPGFEGKQTPVHSIFNNDDEFAGFTKVAQVMRWVNADLGLDRKTKLAVHTGLTRSRIYSITTPNIADRGVMKNIEYRKIAKAMQVIERLESEAMQAEPEHMVTAV